MYDNLPKDNLGCHTQQLRWNHQGDII
jgi:hypothetical protein